MTPTSHNTCAAFVGIDWADATHAGCLQAPGAAQREGFQRAHTPEALDAWVPTLRTRFHGHPVALCLALHTGPLVFALRTYAFLVLCPLQPLTVARYRDAFTPSRAKDAPSAAALQRALLRTPRDTLQPLHPHSPPMRALAQLVAQLRVTVQAIADFATASAPRAQSHPDFPLFHALPGAGPGFAPRLLVACGEQRARSATAAALQT